MLIDKKMGNEILLFGEPILSRNPYNFLKGKKFIVSYENLATYCNLFMHAQWGLSIEDVKWHTKKIDNEDCAIFLRKISDVDDSEDEEEEDVSYQHKVICNKNMSWHSHNKMSWHVILSFKNNWILYLINCSKMLEFMHIAAYKVYQHIRQFQTLNEKLSLNG